MLQPKFTREPRQKKKKRRKGLSLGVRVREHVVEVSFQKESLQQFSRHASKSNFRTSGHLLICVFKLLPAPLASSDLALKAFQNEKGPGQITFGFQCA